ncbi:MAG: outer membrane beta-barrel protein [Gemmatimonadota bacterium]|nr:outer membrane beta-barrel protein [Gemmatimonadota bacterium]
MSSIGRKLVPAALALAFAAAVPATAQAQVFLAGTAGISGFSGDDWDGVGSGFTAGGAIGTRLGGSFTLAGIFGWSTHGTDDTGVALPCIGCTTPGEDDLTAISIEIQPAVRFGAEGSTYFWVGARGGYASVGADEDATGLIIGPVAGVGFPLSSNVVLGAAGNWSILNLSHDDLTDNLKGSKWGIGAYLLYAFGS